MAREKANAKQIENATKNVRCCLATPRIPLHCEQILVSQCTWSLSLYSNFMSKVKYGSRYICIYTYIRKCDLFSLCSNVPECVYFYQDQHLLLYSGLGLSWSSPSSFPIPIPSSPPKRLIGQANTLRWQNKEMNSQILHAQIVSGGMGVHEFCQHSPSKMNGCCHQTAELQAPSSALPEFSCLWQQFPSAFHRCICGSIFGPEKISLHA